MADSIVIENATIFDSTGKEAYGPGTLVIEGDRIKAVGPSSQVSAPRGATTRSWSPSWSRTSIGNPYNVDSSFCVIPCGGPWKTSVRFMHATVVASRITAPISCETIKTVRPCSLFNRRNMAKNCSCPAVSTPATGSSNTAVP